MALNEIFKLTWGKFGLFLFLSLLDLIYTMTSCFGGLCKPDMFYLVRIILFFIFSFLIIYSSKLYSKNIWIRGLLFLFLSGISVFIIRCISSIMEAPHLFLDIDSYKYPVGYSLMTIALLIPTMGIIALISLLIKKLKK